MKSIYFIILICFFPTCIWGQSINPQHDELCHGTDCVYLGDYSLDFRNGKETYSINIPIPNNTDYKYGNTIYLGAGPFIVEDSDYTGSNLYLNLSKDTPYMFHHKDENFYLLYEVITDKTNPHGWGGSYFFHIGFYIIQK